METDVMLFISGKQKYALGEEDSSEFITAGTLQKVSDGYIVSYNESKLTGLEGTKTTLHIKPPMITLTRCGTVNSQMIFEAGKKHLSLYDTDIAGMLVGISTKKVDCNLTDSGGRLEIDYTVEINHEITGENLLTLDIKANKS